MKLQFDANQDYQLQAIHAVVDLFKGQPGREEGIATFGQDSMTSLKLTEVGIANRCVLSPDQWLDNVRAVQAARACPSQSGWRGWWTATARRLVISRTLPSRWRPAPARPMCISAPFMSCTISTVSASS